MDFEQLRNIDSEISDMYGELLPNIVGFCTSSTIPHTSHSLLSLITRTEDIKDAIFDLSNDDNLYSINILFRSLVEHFLKQQYIFFRTVAEKSDKVGEEYIKFCALNEDIDTGLAWKKVATILNKHPTLDPYEILKEKVEGFSQYSKAEILEKTKQFNYRQIIAFINGHINKKMEKDSFLLKIIPAYADLSSFVHGGPNAYEIMLSYVYNGTLNVQLKSKIKLSFMAAANMKLTTLLLFTQYDKSFGKSYNALDSLIKKGIETF